MQAFAERQKVSRQFIVPGQRHGLGSVLSPHAVEFGQFGTRSGAGQDDHVNVTQNWFVANSPENFNTIVTRKMQIEHNDTGTCRMRVLALKVYKLKGFLPVCHNFDFNIFFKP